MATYYFRNAGANWGDTNNWSLSSNGPADGAVRTNANGDTAIFDGSSVACTINITTADCTTIDFTNYLNTITFGNNHLTVHGNITLGNSMGFSTTGGQLKLSVGGGVSSTITPNGKTLGVTLGLTSGGSSPKTITLASDFTIGSLQILSATDFTFNTNILHVEGSITGQGSSYKLDGSTHIKFDGTGAGSWSNSRIETTLTINKTGAGTLTIGSADVWYSGSSKTLTFTAGSNIPTCNGTLEVTSTPTLDTSGMTWNHVRTANSNQTITLTSDLNIGGNFSPGSTNTVTVNGTSKNINVSGNITTGSSGGITGTAKIILTGSSACTWSGAGAIQSNMDIDKTGTLTISGTVAYKTRTLKFITCSGGTPTTSGSTLVCDAAATFDTFVSSTVKIVFQNVTFSNNNTKTISSQLQIRGVFTLSTACTFSGSGGILADSSL